MFVELERQIVVFTKQMKAFVSTSSTSCLVLPALYAGYRYASGKYTPADWFLPYKAT